MVWLLNIGHGAVHYFMLIFSTAVLAMSRDLGRSYGELLPLATVAFAAFGLGTLPAGWLGDRIAKPKLMTAFWLGIGGGSLAVALAQNTWQLAVGLGLIGLFGSLFHPIGVALLVGVSRNTGRSLGIFGISGNLGLAVAALFTGALCDLWGWRASFTLPGALALVLGMVSWRLGRKSPAGQTGAGRQEAPPLPKSARMRAFAGLILVALVGGFVFNSITVALPKVFAERLGDLAGSTAGVGAYVSLVTGLAALSQIVVGFLLDKGLVRSTLMTIGVMQAGLFLAVVNLGGGAMVACFIPLLAAVFGLIPIGDWIVARTATAQWHARVYAAKYVLALSISTTSVPVVAFMHGSAGGFSWLLLALAAAGSLLMAAAFILPAFRAARGGAPGA